MKTNRTDQQATSKTKLALESIKDVVTAIIKDKEFLSPKELSEERLSICYKCPKYENNRCKACGCFMEAKARLIKAKCPLGFWKEKLVEKAMLGEFSDDFNERDCCNGGF